MYWQPEVTNSYLTPIKQRFLYSRKKFIPSNWGIKGNLKSLPYDKMDKKLKKGIEIVKDVNDALISEKYFEDQNFRKIKKKLLLEISYARIEEIFEIILFKNTNVILITIFCDLHTISIIVIIHPRCTSSSTFRHF